MSENTKTIAGVVVDLCFDAGTLLESSGSSHTSVSGSISSDNRGRTSGYIGSTTVDHHKIWLRWPNGREVWYRWTGRDVPMRLGHKISVVMVREGRNVYVVAIINYTTEQYLFAFGNPDEVLNNIHANHTGLHWLAAVATFFGTLALALILAGDNGFFQVVAGLVGSFLGLCFGGFAHMITDACVMPGRRDRLRFILREYCQEKLQQGFPDPAPGDSEPEPAA